MLWPVAIQLIRLVFLYSNILECMYRSKRIKYIQEIENDIQKKPNSLLSPGLCMSDMLVA